MICHQPIHESDKSPPHTNTPLFIDADNSSQRTTKAELEVLVRKVGYGLRNVVDLNVGDTVFVSAANSVMYTILLRQAIVISWLTLRLDSVSLSVPWNSLHW